MQCRAESGKIIPTSILSHQEGKAISLGGSWQLTHRVKNPASASGSHKGLVGEGTKGLLYVVGSNCKMLTNLWGMKYTKLNSLMYCFLCEALQQSHLLKNMGHSRQPSDSSVDRFVSKEETELGDHENKVRPLLMFNRYTSLIESLSCGMC